MTSRRWPYTVERFSKAGSYRLCQKERPMFYLAENSNFFQTLAVKFVTGVHPCRLD